MTYTLFPIISFKKYFYVSLGDIFYCFLWRPLSCGGPGQLPGFPPLKSGPGVSCDRETLVRVRIIATTSDVGRHHAAIVRSRCAQEEAEEFGSLCRMRAKSPARQPSRDPPTEIRLRFRPKTVFRPTAMLTSMTMSNPRFLLRLI